MVENKPEKNALNELVRIGWQNPGFRSEVDDLLTELRLRGSFTEEDEAKIASWKADFTRKVKYKDKQNFSWSDHSKIPPQ